MAGTAPSPGRVSARVTALLSPLSRGTVLELITSVPSLPDSVWIFFFNGSFIYVNILQSLLL